MTRSFSYVAWLKSQADVTRKSSQLNLEKKKVGSQHQRSERWKDEEAEKIQKSEVEFVLFEKCLFRCFEQTPMTFHFYMRLLYLPVGVCATSLHCSTIAAVSVSAALWTFPQTFMTYSNLPSLRPSISSDLLASKRCDSQPARLANSLWAGWVSNLPWFSVICLGRTQRSGSSGQKSKSLCLFSRRSSTSQHHTR